MQPEFDFNGLVRDLVNFRDSVSFHLTEPTSPPEEITAALWQAHELVSAALETLANQYGYKESGLTSFVPKGRGP